MLQDNPSFRLVKGQTSRTWWSYLLWFVCLFFVIGGIATLVALFGLTLILQGRMTDLGLFLGNMLGFPFILLGTLWLAWKQDKRTLDSFAFWSKQWYLKILQGMLMGGVAFVLVWFLAFGLGGLTIKLSPSINPLFLLLSFLAFMIQGTAEEVLCRGYLLPQWRLRFGLWPAILGNAFCFTLLHLGNPGMTPLASLNLMIYGLVFSLLFIWSDNMWLTGAAHGMWNFTQGSIFGVLVSGSRLPYSLFETLPLADKTLLSGGSFGLEGSLLASIFGFLLSVLLWQCIKRKYASA